MKQSLLQFALNRPAQKTITGGIAITYVWTCSNTCQVFTTSQKCKSSCKNGGTCLRTPSDLLPC